MATRSGDTTKRRGTVDAEAEIRRLRSQVARLRAEVRALKSRAQGTDERRRATNQPTPVPGPMIEAYPSLPAPDADGNYPALETVQVIVARQLIRRRQAAGWTQADLAARAGVRQETVSRLETGKHAPNVATVDKLDRALKQAGV